MEENVHSPSVEANRLDRVLAQTRLLVGAYVASNLIFILVGFLIQALVMDEEQGFVRLAESTYSLLYVIGIIVAVVAAFVGIIYLASTQSPSAIVQRENVGSIEGLVKQLQQGVMRRAGALQVVGIVGLVLFFLNGNFAHLLQFTGAAVVLYLFLWPRRGRWLAAAESSEL